MGCNRFKEGETGKGKGCNPINLPQTSLDLQHLFSSYCETQVRPLGSYDPKNSGQSICAHVILAGSSG